MLTLTSCRAKTDKSIVWPTWSTHSIHRVECNRKTGHNKSEIRALIVVANYIRLLLNFSLCHSNLIFLPTDFANCWCHVRSANNNPSLLWLTNEWAGGDSLLCKDEARHSPDTCLDALVIQLPSWAAWCLSPGAEILASRQHN